MYFTFLERVYSYCKYYLQDILYKAGCRGLVQLARGSCTGLVTVDPLRYKACKSVLCKVLENKMKVREEV